jgi:bifunctional enzyme CysN/CysC
MPAGTTAELLRFATCGSVDDGKSTLIGRLLYDSKSVLADQMAHVAEVSERRGAAAPDLALLTDGLRAEREQGITIDVAYRAFATPRRRFIIADCPGHVQYTRNMVTGSSTADLSLVLVDARYGVVEQTRRHAAIAALLRVPHLAVGINKMDLVDWDEGVFERTSAAIRDAATRLGIADVTCVPISALNGDNVVERSAAMPWYEGPTLLHHLEHVPLAPHGAAAEARFPVQWVIRPREAGRAAERTYAGQMAGGELAAGDEVVVLPSGRRSRIAAIETFDGPLERAAAPLAVALRLADDLDVARGDLICRPERAAAVTRELDAMVCWMSEAPLRAGGRYAIKHTTRTARAAVESVASRLDVATLDHDEAAAELHLNDIGRVRLRTSAPLAVDPYARNRETGAFILIDEATNDTVGAGMLAG